MSYSTVDLGNPRCSANKMPDLTVLPRGIKLELNNPETTGIPDDGFEGPIRIIED